MPSCDKTKWQSRLLFTAALLQHAAPFRDEATLNLQAQNLTNGEAAHLQAMRAAEGVGTPQNWDEALDSVQRSAELEYHPAQAELAALAGEWELAQQIFNGARCGVEKWAALRKDVNIAKWLAVPLKRIVSASPRIATVPELASPNECRWLISRARGKLSRAQVYDPQTGGPRSESVRTNSQAVLLRDENDLVLLFLRARIAQLIELPVPWLEAAMMLHYAPGEEFLPHLDFLDTDLPGPAADVAERGQRVVTFLVALNSEYEGGETEFSELGRRWKGPTGSGLFFWNVEPDGRPDPRTRHAGLPPVNGEKWLLSQWVRARPVRR